MLDIFKLSVLNMRGVGTLDMVQIAGAADSSYRYFGSGIHAGEWPRYLFKVRGRQTLRQRVLGEH